jgi:type VI secretion system protein ImpC
MADKLEQKTAAVVTHESGALLEEILSKGFKARDDAQVERSKSLISDFVEQVMNGQLVMSKNLEASINARIAEIDRLLSAQTNEIMHHEKYQKLEASWRGLHHLVFETETSTMLKIRVMNVNKESLGKELEKAIEFDQSTVFKGIYEQEYGMFGGEPFGLLIGDYEITNHPKDINFLKKMSEVAAAAHAPFITSASPRLFGWDNFTELTDVRDLAKIFDQVEYGPWRSFRESEDSRYVGLTLPHTLMRLPYSADGEPTETFNFTEDVDGKDHSKYLWGNAAYSFGTRVTEAFALYNWCVAIRGVEGGGLVTGLPYHTFSTDEGEVALKCPTEIAITDRREKEFSDLGFIPLVHCKNQDYAAFFGAQSCNKPKKYNTDDANANARLSSQLQYMFAVSRIAHYLKSICRDKIGSFMSRSDCEVFLNTWIMNYVTPDDNAPPTVKARLPLRDARVEVMEVPGKPGVYKAIAYLRPHFQLDELSVSLRLVAELPQPSR